MASIARTQARTLWGPHNEEYRRVPKSEMLSSVSTDSITQGNKRKNYIHMFTAVIFKRKNRICLKYPTEIRHTKHINKISDTKERFIILSKFKRIWNTTYWKH